MATTSTLTPRDVMPWTDRADMQMHAYEHQQYSQSVQLAPGALAGSGVGAALGGAAENSEWAAHDVFTAPMYTLSVTPDGQPNNDVHIESTGVAKIFIDGVEVNKVPDSFGKWLERKYNNMS